MITHTIDGMLRPRVAVMRHTALDTRLDEAIALRRCALYRKAFRGMGVSYPADVLRFESLASWIRDHGVGVDVASRADVDLLRMAGVHASQVVMHCHGELSASSRRAAFARFVVDCAEQVAELADNPLDRTQRVVVAADSSDELAGEVLAHRPLDLVGLHYRVGTVGLDELADRVSALIARMAWITRKHGVTLSRVSLGDVDLAGCDRDLRSVRRVAKVVDQAVEDGCIQCRYPRPALTVSPRLPA